MSVYPNGVGIKLNTAAFSNDQIQALKSKLSKKDLIRIYGLAGVGKGTLSKMISESLAIPNIESSLILRCTTLIYETENLEETDENTDLVFDKMKISTNSTGLTFEVDGRIIAKNDLKNSFVDTYVSHYAQNIHIREKFDNALKDLVENKMTTASIFDGRGSHEPYLVEAEEKGFNVIRILVDCDLKTKADRYVQAIIDTRKVENPTYDPNGSEMEELFEEFQKTVAERDQNDIRNILEKNLGLISADSGLLDTANLTPQEALETALSFIETRVK